ncbi:hypothetical protein U1Q18_031752, partial [Sarracenia purpurea var. burkii]
ELSMVSSTVFMLRSRISSERSSSADTIFTACPGIRRDIVFRRTFAPENFTSTSATPDFELAASSLALSMAEVEEGDDEEEEEDEDGNDEDGGGGGGGGVWCNLGML